MSKEIEDNDTIGTSSGISLLRGLEKVDGNVVKTLNGGNLLLNLKFDDNSGEDANLPLHHSHESDDGEGVDELNTFDSLTSAELEQQAKGTFHSSVINILNTILGAGLLTMSMAMSSIGLIPGTLVIAFMGFASGSGLYLLSVCAERVPGKRKSSFFALASLTFPRARFFIDAAIAIKCFGVACTYLIVVKQLVPVVYKGLSGGVALSNPWSNSFVLVALSLVIVMPLTLLKKLTALRYTSALALTGVIYLFAMTIYFYVERDSLRKEIFPAGGDEGPWDDAKHGANLFTLKPFEALSSFPVFVFAFTCHQNIFPVHNEAKNNSRPFMKSVITFCLIIAISLYISMGTLGYLTYGKFISSNLLKQYPGSRIATQLGQALYILLTVLSYPLQSHPCRASLEKLIPLSPDKRFRHHRLIYYGLSFTILASSFFVAAFIDDLSQVLAVVGATGSTTICYILPSTFYLSLYYGNRKNGQNDTAWKREAYYLVPIAYLLGVLGIFTLGVCFPMAVWNIISKNSSALH